MNLPTTMDGALAMLGELIQDDRLGYGLATVAVVLFVSGLIAWAILDKVVRR